MIKILNGPYVEFEKILPKDIKYNTLSELMEELNAKEHVFILKTSDNENEEYETKKKDKKQINNLVIKSYEYSRLSDSGLNGFMTLINSFDIKNMYLQNPPSIVVKQLKDAFSNNIHFINHQYKKIDESILSEFSKHYEDKILGQDLAKRKLLNQLYILSKSYNESKPIVLLLFGPTGVGKTETAKYISELLNEKLFRKQLSMYQNEEFANYVFGSKVSEASLARDLLERESNIILLDEFDKINSVFYSAFYQMFDEGVFVDKNYKVNLKNSIIICTSNFSNINQIKKELGEPIFSRLDNVIEFDPLSDTDVKKLIKISFNKIYSKLSDDEKSILNKYETLETLLKLSKKINNAREVSVITKDFLFTTITSKKFFN